MHLIKLIMVQLPFYTKNVNFDIDRLLINLVLCKYYYATEFLEVPLIILISHFNKF